MSLYKAIKYGKEKRKPYRKSKAIDSSCRNHGRCAYCRQNRLYQVQKENIRLKSELAWLDIYYDWYYTRYEG